MKIAKSHNKSLEDEMKSLIRRLENRVTRQLNDEESHHKRARISCRTIDKKFQYSNTTIHAGSPIHRQGFVYFQPMPNHMYKLH